MLGEVKRIIFNGNKKSDANGNGNGNANENGNGNSNGISNGNGNSNGNWTKSGADLLKKENSGKKFGNKSIFDKKKS